MEKIMPLAETQVRPLPLRSTASRGDILRLAFLLMLFANVVLGPMLAARAPGLPLAEGPVAVQWHGNAVGHQMR